MEKKASSFSGQIGFVLAAAGSAVGVGNLWRFPYLAAKDGGGLFLLVYLVLVLTFGFTLLTSDIAIGRRTKQSAIRAYETMRPKWKFLGILTFLVPVLIMTYYAVIGGWITKYAVVYLTGQSAAAAEDGYFTSFITSPVSPVVFALLFMGVTAFIVYNGVEGGIERVSRYMMPILLVLVVVIAGYALTLRHEDASGQMRTGMEGFVYYLTPHLEGLTVSRFLQILHTEMHRRNAFVFGSKRQSPRHVAQTREGVRAVNHGRKRSLAVEIVFFDNLPRQGHQQHGIVGYAHGLFVEKSKNNRAENQQKDQVQGQTPQKIQPAPASLQHLQHLRLSCLNSVSCRPASERYARDGPAQTGNRLQRRPRRAPACDAVRACDSPRTKPSPCRVSWPS